MGGALLTRNTNVRLSKLDKAGRYALQKAAREEAKRNLLSDILFDMEVCRLEGWDHTEYPTDLLGMLSDIVGKFGKKTIERKKRDC